MENNTANLSEEDREKASELLKEVDKLYNEEKFEGAIQRLEEVLEIDKKNPYVLILLGICFESQNNYVEAQRCYDCALELEPENKNALLRLGHCYYEQKDYSRAINYYNHALEIDTKNIEALLWLGHCYYEQKDLAKAIKKFNQCLLIDPDYKYASYWVGKALYKNGQQREALDYFAKSEINLLDLFLSLREDSDENEVLINIREILEKRKEDENEFFWQVVGKLKNEGEEALKLYKTIYVSSLSLFTMLHVRDVEETKVAHYTTKSVAERLLFTDQKDNRLRAEKEKLGSSYVLPLSLFTIATANDPQEGNTLLKFLDIDDSCHDTEEYEAFIACFTFNHESLNQFRLYGKENGYEATGASIVFDRKKLFTDTLSLPVKIPVQNQKENKENKKYCLFRCVYIDPKTNKVISIGQREKYTFYRDNEPSPLERYKVYQRRIYRKTSDISEHFKELREIVVSNKDKLNHAVISELLLNLRYLVKHVAFKEEQECRMITVESLHSNEKILIEDDRKMYIEYEDIRLFVTNIYFAPKTDGFKVFRDRLKKDMLNYIKCRRCDHPYT